MVQHHLHGSSSLVYKQTEDWGLEVHYRGEDTIYLRMLDRYTEILHTLKAHKLEIFIKPCGFYILCWVREFYTTYEVLVSQMKN